MNLINKNKEQTILCKKQKAFQEILQQKQNLINLNAIFLRCSVQYKEKIL
ncbi:hypothetical protein TTHERM_00314950 (macronuclear) [Tetrahymena thermophila SB210]|uniref:Uncharacterized protein n=1 Tax=Tetrahymena thermophila (strain SB210) TaxID=312017 RepID=I7MG34_TETTS|nr:hypothetical protein TTHERM_00314950 [Tetrahymena thermophila SB210]EAS01041.1 hypothetical protein TTHERM_00314950 [Tetrahymena thermophila SB210]|eukprot:XP_001021286.1 hypothetical protein TTHERM_00314950 [Tetrahymena thermophila SB210]